MPKKSTKKAAVKAPVTAYILLDRSGSMDIRMQEAIGSINAYAKELAKSGTAADITLCTFDDVHGMQFEVVRRRVTAKEWKPVEVAEVSPRGGTPLYDAIDRIVMAAEIEGADRTVIAIMTDGYENASKSITREKAKQILDKARAKDWEVIFMGADFDAMAQSASVGNQVSKTINISVGNYQNTMRGFAGSTAAYATGQAINFTDADRAVAGGTKVSGSNARGGI